MGVKLFIGTPRMRNEVVLKTIRNGLCETAWSPLQPLILFSRMGVGGGGGVDLQSQPILEVHLS